MAWGLIRGIAFLSLPTLPWWASGIHALAGNRAVPRCGRRERADMEDGIFFFNVQTVWGTHSNKGKKEETTQQSLEGPRGLRG